MLNFKKQFVFVIVGAIILIAGGIIIWAGGNRGDNPYIYLKMDEGVASTTYDFSGNANVGTLNGGVLWGQENECVSGKCVNLDGVNDFVSIPDFDLQ